MTEETLFNILEITRVFSHLVIDSGYDARISHNSFICALTHQCKKSEFLQTPGPGSLSTSICPGGLNA